MLKMKPSTLSEKSNKPKSAAENKTKIKVLETNKRRGRGRGGKKKIKRKPKREPRGVVYISHIPHGFYEEQIDAFFSQFGKLTAVSLPRSKSGRAKGYAFIEYKLPEVAKIAADTMNNYLMYNRLLKTKYIAPEQQKPRLFYIAKAARENHKTAADKAALTVAQNRKLKNRHLKISLEAKYAAKLLKKKNSLMKRAEKLGLDSDFMTEEANIQSVFDKKKEIELNKKKKNSEKALKPNEGEGTNTSEELLSSSENTEDSQSLDDVDLLSEDVEDDDTLSESDEEDYKKMIVRAKKAAKDILKRKPKYSKLKGNNKDQAALNASAELSSKKQNNLELTVPQEELLSEKSPSHDKSQSSKVVPKLRKRNTSLKITSPKKEAMEDGLKQNKNLKPKKSKERKCLNKSAVDKTSPSVKRMRTPSQTPTDKKSNISKVVMEVDKNDEEINFKTPPNVVKKFIVTKKDPVKKTTKEKSNKPFLLPPKSTKKTPRAVKSPGELSSLTLQKSPSGKKPRHRQLKRLLSAQ